MSALELIFDYFEDHVRMSAVVRERRPLALGILGFLIGGLSVFVAQALTQRLMLLSFSWPSLAVVAVWKVVAGFLLASILHLILEMQNLKGDAVALFILFGFADLVWALAVPLVLVLKAVSGSSWLVTAAFMAVGFASLSLKARSLQDNYRISSGRAWFTLGLPYLGGVALAILGFSFLVARLVLSAWQAVN